MITQTTFDHHDHPTSVGRRSPRSDRRALVALLAGAALTVLAMIALAVDLAGAGRLDQHLRQVYDGHAVEPPSVAVVAGYLFAAGTLGVVGWVMSASAARRQARWVAPVASLLLALGLTLAVANLTVAEYGQTILPLEVGLVSLLLCVPGLAAVLELWRSRGR